MPNLPVHIQLAGAAAEEIGSADLDSNLGYFYLGSTSPDIRAITRRARSEYHFVELDFETIGSGIEAMFAAYPELMNSAEHDAPTRAFVAGYMAHLLTDETYIVRMFRSYFGEGGVFEDETRAKVWDRALQLDLDRDVWERVARTMGGAEVTPSRVSVRFLPEQDLSTWTDWVYRVVDGGFTWDRLRFMARRISAGDDQSTALGHAEQFIDSVHDSLRELYDLVPRASVEEFRSEAVETVVTGLREYLS